MTNLYNEEIKEKFLNTYDNEQTQKTIRNVFAKTYLIENTLDKDMYEMNIEDLGRCIANTEPHNVGVARSNGRFISQYISHCTEIGLRKSNLNPLKTIDLTWYNNFVDRNKKIYYSKSEFLELLGSMLNAQDQSFLILCWNGISGKSFSQLKDLKYSDINFETNEVYVKERNVNIKIDQDFMPYLQKANDQDTYYTYNPETNEHNESLLLPSPYLFKNLKSPRSRENVPVAASVFYTRLTNIRNEFDLEYLTPNSLKMSGMVALSVELFKEHGVLRYEQFAEIGEKYDYNKLKSGDFEYYNTNLMKQFINNEVIEDLYGIQVIIEKR